MPLVPISKVVADTFHKLYFCWDDAETVNIFSVSTTKSTESPYMPCNQVSETVVVTNNFICLNVYLQKKLAILYTYVFTFVSF